jgi:hypothetical protein
MLTRLLWRWFSRTVVAVAIVFVAVYGQRTEYDYQGTLDAPCAVALFPQAGMSPCWQLKKNPNQGMNL